VEVGRMGYIDLLCAISHLEKLPLSYSAHVLVTFFIPFFSSSIQSLLGRAGERKRENEIMIINKSHTNSFLTAMHA
jgi:hypothetical protein